MPFGRLALKPIAALECFRPGLVVRTIQSRGARRHATFALLETISAVEVVKTLRAEAYKTPNDNAPESLRRMAEMAKLIETGSTRDIIINLRGGVVADGFIGALDRLGDDPLPMGLYGKIADLFENGDPRAVVLRQIEGQIEPGMIEALLIVDEIALHANIASAIT